MLNRRKKAALKCTALALVVMFSVSGCQLLDKNNETESESESETMSETESETETETETEFQTDVVYISEDETIRIVLPDSTWKVTQDIDEMRVFSSGADAMINIVHVSDEDSMSNISVMETEDELEESLSGQYSGDNAFEIVSFEERSSSTVETYEYVVKYTDSTSMWAYSVTYGILSVKGDAAYVISGTVTEDDEDLLEAVRLSVESFTVLDADSVFSVLPGAVENNETEADTEDEDDSVGSEELATLTAYSSSVTLYASSNVNIRELPGTDAERIGSLILGDAVTVTGETSGWFRVSVGSTVGYVSKAYLVSTQPETDSDSSDDSSEEAAAELATATSYGTSYTYYTTASVNVRSQPSTDSSVASTASSGSAVTVIGETDNWYIVSVNGTTGYISKAYVSSTQPASTTTDDSSSSTDSSTSTASGSTDSTASTSGVVSGTITAVTSDTLLIYGEDGVTYSVNYANASLSTSGLTEGLYVTATIDYSQSTASGSLYATNVTGY
ncbi:MAG: SH3 domain-containing protein [Lachnospiraceae bacterium]|nr:SH3 domain-containing protein [Lachnospiraceae bacterium]